MSWISELEDAYTVSCRVCKQEYVDPGKRPRQKFLIGKCPSCAAIHIPKSWAENAVIAAARSEFQKRCLRETEATTSR